MSRQPGFLVRLAVDRSGTSVIEFAVIAPIIIALMIGVLQVGMAMQSYNAIRSVTAETQRYAIVEYQKGLSPSNLAIRTQAISIADGAPYLLAPRNLTVTIGDAATQRVSGAREMTVTISYRIPTVLPLLGFAAPTVSHSRPIFVLT